MQLTPGTWEKALIERGWGGGVGRGLDGLKSENHWINAIQIMRSRPWYGYLMIKISLLPRTGPTNYNLKVHCPFTKNS